MRLGTGLTWSTRELEVHIDPDHEDTQILVSRLRSTASSFVGFIFGAFSIAAAQSCGFMGGDAEELIRHTLRMTSLVRVGVRERVAPGLSLFACLGLLLGGPSCFDENECPDDRVSEVVLDDFDGDLRGTGHSPAELLLALYEPGVLNLLSRDGVRADAAVQIQSASSVGTLTRGIFGGACEHDMLELDAELRILQPPTTRGSEEVVWIQGFGLLRFSRVHLRENFLRWSGTVTQAFIDAFALSGELSDGDAVGIGLDVFIDPLPGIYGSVYTEDVVILEFAVCEAVLSEMKPPVCG